MYIHNSIVNYDKATIYVDTHKKVLSHFNTLFIVLLILCDIRFRVSLIHTYVPITVIVPAVSLSMILSLMVNIH